MFYGPSSTHPPWTSTSPLRPILHWKLPSTRRPWPSVHPSYFSVYSTWTLYTTPASMLRQITVSNSYILRPLLLTPEVFSTLHPTIKPKSTHRNTQRRAVSSSSCGPLFDPFSFLLPLPSRAYVLLRWSLCWTPSMRPFADVRMTMFTLFGLQDLCLMSFRSKWLLHPI